MHIKRFGDLQHITVQMHCLMKQMQCRDSLLSVPSLLEVEIYREKYVH